MAEEREISDAQTMRALAHPVRLQLLELIRRDGDTTASRAAVALGESAGNMSWHLQTLAKYGYIDEAPGAKGRSRPWKIAAGSQRIKPSPEDPAAGAAAEVLARQIMQREVDEALEWLSQRASYPPEWQNAGFLVDNLCYLTPDELGELGDAVMELFERYSGRTDKSERPEGSLPIRLSAGAHPLPKTTAGN